MSTRSFACQQTHLCGLLSNVMVSKLTCVVSHYNGIVNKLTCMASCYECDDLMHGSMLPLPVLFVDQ